MLIQCETQATVRKEREKEQERGTQGQEGGKGGLVNMRASTLDAGQSKGERAQERAREQKRGTQGGRKGKVDSSRHSSVATMGLAAEEPQVGCSCAPSLGAGAQAVQPNAARAPVHQARVHLMASVSSTRSLNKSPKFSRASAL